MADLVPISALAEAAGLSQKAVYFRCVNGLVPGAVKLGADSLGRGGRWYAPKSSIASVKKPLPRGPRPAA